MAKVYKHPISGCIYSVTDVGLVRVDDPATGRYGIFDDNGVWFEAGSPDPRRATAATRLGIELLMKWLEPDRPAAISGQRVTTGVRARVVPGRAASASTTPRTPGPSPTAARWSAVSAR